MEEVKVETGVDDLISLLESSGTISIKDASQKLKIDESYIQAWVDFLVEEKVLGIEYKFTKPYIFLNNKKLSSSIKTINKTKQTESTLALIKKDYLAHAKEKHISEEKTLVLWNKHIMDAIVRKKDYFFREAKKRNITNVDDLFDRYVKKLRLI